MERMRPASTRRQRSSIRSDGHKNNPWKNGAASKSGAIDRQTANT
jgi:hypothetical protein